MQGDQMLTQIEKDFPSIRFLSLEDHLKIEVRNKTYLVQVFQSGNPKAPWDTHVYVDEGGKWKYLADFPWRDDKSREATIRLTLSLFDEWNG